MPHSGVAGMMATVPPERDGRHSDRMPVGRRTGGKTKVDSDRFDTLARALGEGATRRTILGTAGVSALGAFGLTALLGADEAEAEKGSKKRKRRRRRCKLTNLRDKSCSADKECCTNKNYVCGIPFGGTQGDPEKCCGVEDAPCDVPSDCYSGLTCPTGGGACEFVKMAG
jgi:hypothetical protein